MTSKEEILEELERKWDLYNNVDEDVYSSCSEEVKYWLSQKLDEYRDIAVKEYLIKTLQDFNKNNLEGKGFDFYFVLRNDLDEINSNFDKLK